MPANEKITFNDLIAGLLDPGVDHMAIREAWQRAALDRDEQEESVVRNMALAHGREPTSAKKWGHSLAIEYRLTSHITGNQFSVGGPDRPMTQIEFEAYIGQQIKAKTVAEC
jgi:hypothetical protein